MWTVPELISYPVNASALACINSASGVATASARHHVHAVRYTDATWVC